MYRLLFMYAHVWMVGCTSLVLFLCGVVCCVGICGDGVSQASKADVEAKENKGGTPLHWASYKGHVKVVELLLVREAWQRRGKCLYLYDQGRVWIGKDVGHIFRMYIY